MKKNMMTAALSALTLCTLIAAAPVAAHSDHDHSYLPVGWKFNQAVQAKIEKNLVQGTSAVGLSKIEQKILDGYHINVGNSFNTRVGGMMMKIVRTSSGLRIDGTVPAQATKFELPVIEGKKAIRPISLNSHPGHAHQRLELSWIFNEAIEEKIQAHVFNEKANGAIGLTSSEQKTLEHYGIRIGNSFRAYVDNMAFTVKRTSMGLQILTHETASPVAKAESASRNY